MTAGDVGMLVGLAALMLLGVVVGSTVVLTKPKPAREIRVLTNREREDAFRRRLAAHRAARGELAWPFVDVVEQFWRDDVQRALWDSQAVIALRRTYFNRYAYAARGLFPALAIVGRAPKTPGSPNRANVATKDVRALAPRAARGSDAAV